jgi:serine protease Do
MITTSRYSVATAFFLCVFCTTQALGQAATSAAVAKPAKAPKLNIQEAPPNRDQRAPMSYAPVIRKASPSVVNIFSTMTVRERPALNPFLNDPLFRRFFGDDSGPAPQPRERKSQSLGSGVIISPDGYILTANHVVEGADSVKVALVSGDKEYDARVVGTDPPTDLAVLKIDAKRELPAIAIADSDKLEVGDVVLAIGNPFGVGQTVTMGIVSGIGRGGFGISGYEDFIQTDAAINPGNSGGALVDAEGRLVGINTAILSRSGGFMGVGFAVPMNMARFVMERLIESGKVTRGYLGVNIQSLTPDLAKLFRLPDESAGALVGGVMPDSPAAKAGLQNGDVIVALDNKKITDSRALQLMVARTPPGTRVTLRVLHAADGGKPEEKPVTVVLGTLPQEAVAGTNLEKPGTGSSTLDALDGIEVTDLDNATRRQFNVPRDVRGALVVNLDPGSVAAQAGLRAGDVILEIDRQPVRSAEEAVKLSEQAKGGRVLLRAWSRSETGQSGTRYIVVEGSRKR